MSTSNIVHTRDINIGTAVICCNDNYPLISGQLKKGEKVKVNYISWVYSSSTPDLDDIIHVLKDDDRVLGILRSHFETLIERHVVELYVPAAEQKAEEKRHDKDSKEQQVKIFFPKKKSVIAEKFAARNIRGWFGFAILCNPITCKGADGKMRIERGKIVYAEFDEGNVVIDARATWSSIKDIAKGSSKKTMTGSNERAVVVNDLDVILLSIEENDGKIAEIVYPVSGLREIIQLAG